MGTYPSISSRATHGMSPFGGLPVAAELLRDAPAEFARSQLHME